MHYFHLMCMSDARLQDLLNLFGSHMTMIGVSGPRIILPSGEYDHAFVDT